MEIPETLERSIRRQANIGLVVISALALAGLVALGATISDLAEVTLLRQVVAGFEVTQEAAQASDDRQLLMALAQVVLMVITAVPFLIWQHRAYSNLTAIGTGWVFASPGWTVGYWFIPIANIFKPYVVMKELWQRSRVANKLPDPKTVRVPPTVGLWWTSFVGSTGLSRVSSAWYDSAQSAEDLLRASWGTLASDVLWVIAAGLAIAVVQNIRQLQLNMPEVAALTPHQEAPESQLP